MASKHCLSTMKQCQKQCHNVIDEALVAPIILFLPSNQMGQLKHHMFVLMVLKIHEMNTLDS
jgi:hypothetical protein